MGNENRMKSVIFYFLLTFDSWSEETSHLSVMKKTLELFLCIKSVLLIPEGPTYEISVITPSLATAAISAVQIQYVCNLSINSKRQRKLSSAWFLPSS